ncbi:MAG: hypothetical protein COA82_07910 [Alkaliphilus sp.]|nr:hypothetical protein [Alkaliphilus sp. AH-315-G20]PHS33906.1 MAG: hypothetical protein COA82_07910 [Alkaliphilus sp.]
MLSQNQTLDFLINRLISEGFPSETLAIGYKLGGLKEIELAVIDINTNLPIVLFVTIENQGKIEVNGGRARLQTIAKSLDQSVISCMVYPIDDEPYFGVYEINNYAGVIISTNLPKFNDKYYKGKRNAILSGKARNAEKKKKSEVNRLSFASWLSALIIFNIFILQIIKIIELDAISITLIGVIIGLVIIPFASKIKFFGIEFERYTREKKE